MATVTCQRCGRTLEGTTTGGRMTRTWITDTMY